MARVEGWMRSRGMEPLAHQREAWGRILAGHSGAVCVPTGGGKTLAVWGAALARGFEEQPDRLTTLYVSPLRALGNNLAERLREAAEPFDGAVRVETRNSDTLEQTRARQRRNPPHALVTTPETLAVMLTWLDADAYFAALRTIVVDEWHSLLDSKRGSLLELTLAAVRAAAPCASTWGLSATGHDPARAAAWLAPEGRTFAMVASGEGARPSIEVLVPDPLETLSWAGHLGLRSLQGVLAAIDIERSTILFTNTRSQAELWYAELVRARPEWFEWMGLHHGSMAAAERLRIEQGLQDRSVRLVVATSSLEQGIDVGAVDRVIHIGSPRSIGRLVQRAGRSRHRPGETPQVLCVPTHAAELCELRALARAVTAGASENPGGLDGPLDVLVQHIVTRAIPGRTTADALHAEVLRTAGYRGLTRERFDVALRVACEGGSALANYPQFRRVVVSADGRLCIATAQHARLHRLNIGTVCDDVSVPVKLGRRDLGTVEEGFAARLREGDVFLFQGRALAFSVLRDGALLVRPSRAVPTLVPRWMGGQLAISSELAPWIRGLWDDAQPLAPTEAECEVLRQAQRAVAPLPGGLRFHLEWFEARDGVHLLGYPFEGAVANETLALLLAWRWLRSRTASLGTAANEYGFEILAPRGTAPPADLAEWLSPAGVEEQIHEAVAVSQIARRHFRELARIAGFTQTRQPRGSISGRKLQASAGLIFDVLRDHDPTHPLLLEALRETLERRLDLSRATSVLERAREHGHLLTAIQRPGPLAFALMVETTRARLSNETLEERVSRMRRVWNVES